MLQPPSLSGQIVGCEPASSHGPFHDQLVQRRECVCPEFCESPLLASAQAEKRGPQPTLRVGDFGPSVPMVRRASWPQLALPYATARGSLQCFENVAAVAAKKRYPNSLRLIRNQARAEVPDSLEIRSEIEAGPATHTSHSGRPRHPAPGALGRAPREARFLTLEYFTVPDQVT